MPEDIFDNDVVSRSVLDPKDYVSGVLDLRKSFQFSNNNQYRQSVNCNRLLNDDVMAIHKLGLDKQALDHANGRTERTYKGYCQSVVEPIRKINVNELAHFKVCHFLENNNNAHCHIEMYFTQKNARSEAVNQLVECFSDLIPY